MHSKIFLKLSNERGQQAYEIYISDFCEKDLVQGEWVIVGPKMLYLEKSGSAFKEVFVVLHIKKVEEALEN